MAFALRNCCSLTKAPAGLSPSPCSDRPVKPIGLAFAADELLGIFENPVGVAVFHRIVALRIDIGARRLDRLDLVLANPPVEDLLKPGLGIEGPLAVLQLSQREGERPDFIAKQQDSLIAVFLDAEELGRPLADRLEMCP